MRKVCVFLILGFGFALATGSKLEGQAGRPETITVVDSSKIQVIKVSDGSTFIGRVVRIGTDSVVVETGGGSITLARASIRSVTVRPASSIKDGEYWVQNPNTSRLLFGPTGQMLKQGEGYLAAFELAFLGGAWGISDNFTMGGGVLLPSATTVYFVTPKLGFSPSPNVHVATGAMLIGLADGGESIGVYYGVATRGDADQSITGGLGYGFSGTDVARQPVFMIGGEKRFSNRIALVTENYIIPDLDPLIGIGIRFIGEKLSADLGIMRVGDSGGSITIPLINFVAKF